MNGDFAVFSAPTPFFSSRQVISRQKCPRASVDRLGLLCESGLCAAGKVFMSLISPSFWKGMFSCQPLRT